MTIKALYATQDEIPETYRDLYEERDGQFHLQKIEGLATSADLSRVSRSLEAERAAHKKTKEGYAALGDRPIDEVLRDLDRIPELEAAASDKFDPAKLEELAEARLKTKLSPVERERDQYKTKLAEAEQRIAQFEELARQRSIHDAVRAAAGKAKVIDTAMDDVLMLAERMFEVGEDGEVTARDGVGVTPGVGPEVWLTEMQSKRPHWWPPSVGSGGKGSGGSGGFTTNPWSADGWNLTEQGRVLRELGADKAAQMAKAAGTTVGGRRPVAGK